MHNGQTMVRILLVVWLVAAAAVTPRLAWAQDLASPVAARPAGVVDELVLRDGSRLYGAAERESDTEIVFRTVAGVVVTVPRADVVRLSRMRGTVVNGEFRRADPNRTRLFFAPTGRALEQGDVYAGLFSIVMPFVQVGLTDRVSVGGGTPLVFGLFDDWNRPYWITPKVLIVSRDRAQVSAGAFHVFDRSGNGGGIAYGVGTFGTDDEAVTLGAGLSYTGFDSGAAVVMAGGERRVHRSLKLLTENYLWVGDGDTSGLVSAGIRFFGERLSADVGVAMPIGSGDLWVFPVVSIVYVF